jgi:hypothetical protein
MTVKQIFPPTDQQQHQQIDKQEYDQNPFSFTKDIIVEDNNLVIKIDVNLNGIEPENKIRIFDIVRRKFNSFM